jgi:hypothetical protein
MRGAISPLPQYAFMAWCLVKHRDNFSFTVIPSLPPPHFFAPTLVDYGLKQSKTNPYIYKYNNCVPMGTSDPQEAVLHSLMSPAHLSQHFGMFITVVMWPFILRPLLILNSPIKISMSSCPILLGFRTRIMHGLLTSTTRATCPAHPHTLILSP